MEKEIAAAVEKEEPSFWTINSNGDPTNKPLWINVKLDNDLQLIEPTELTYENWKTGKPEAWSYEYCESWLMLIHIING